MFYGLWKQKQKTGNSRTISEEEGGRNRCGDRAESSVFLGSAGVHTYICLKDFRRKEREKQMIDKERGKQMTDKEIIINDQKNTIHRLQQECTEKTNAIIALGERLKAKEQECEELKKELDLYKTWYRAKHGDVKNLLGNYRKALTKIEYEAIEETKDLEADTDAYGCFMEILNIIDKATQGLTTR